MKLTGTGPTKAPPISARNISSDRIARRVGIDVGEPAQLPIVARVTMNGCRSNRATSQPLSQPTATPMASATRIASEKCICACSPVASRPASASTEPTERSMPPVRITISIPRLRKPLVTICRETLTMLRWVRKASETRLAPITSSTTAAANSRSARLKRGCSRRAAPRAGATSVNAPRPAVRPRAGPRHGRRPFPADGVAAAARRRAARRA